jgi:hypothetical protein
MKSFILYYLIAGVIWNLIWDLLVSYLAKEDALAEDSARLVGFERVIMGLAWPYAMLVFFHKLWTITFKK